MVLSRIIKNLSEYEDIQENSELCDLIIALNSFDINDLFYFEDPLNMNYSEIRSTIHEIDRFLYNSIETEINEKLIDFYIIVLKLKLTKTQSALLNLQ